MSELSLRIKTFFKMNCYIFCFPKASSFAARITSSKSDVDFSIRSNCSFWSDAATRLAVPFMVSHKPVGGTNRICICVQKLQISTVCIPDIASGGRDQNRPAATFPNFLQKGMQIIRVSSVCHQMRQFLIIMRKLQQAEIILMYMLLILTISSAGWAVHSCTRIHSGFSVQKVTNNRVTGYTLS